MYSFFKYIPLLSLSLNFSAFAATQGSLGTTSSGNLQVSITIPALVQITGLTDIALGSVSAFPALGNTTACIYSSVAAPLGSYFVTASSNNADSGNFRVQNTATSTFIVYSAFWNNTSAIGGVALQSGVTTARQLGGNATSLTCGGTPNANFNVSFSAAQVAGAPAGNYIDTVTLVITSAV